MEESWRECSEWFSGIGLISHDHLLNTKVAKLTDFCRFLRDGVMPCKLLHIIDSDSIDLRSINQRPQCAQFLCMKNIGIFLQTCENKFGLSKNDLFEPENLFEYSNFKKVLATLSVLSKTQKALQITNGFPKDLDEDRDDDDIYATLPKDMANGSEREACSNNNNNNNNNRFFDDYDDPSYNEIYADLKLGRQWEEEDEIYSEPIQDLEVRRDPPKERRDLCLQELMDTEHNYVEALGMLCDKFYKPLKKIMPEDQLKKIFCKIPKLAEIHMNLLEGLKGAQNNRMLAGNPWTVAQVFRETQESLLIYGDYCSNLTIAQQELEDLIASNDTVRLHIQECQQEVSNGRHQLREYLVVPLQRILKYHLLLHELIKHTPDGHPEYSELNKAKEDMMDLAEYINEVKRDNEMLQIIKDLKTSIMEMPSEISDYEELGKLRHDGETSIKCHPESIRKRYVFIFDKVMVICSRQTKRLSDLFQSHSSNRWSMGEVTIEDEKYYFKDLIRLESCQVQDNLIGATHTNTKNKQNSFYIVLNGNKKAYTIQAKDVDTKMKWKKDISDAIKYLNPDENQTLGHTFTPTTFTEANTRCCVCRKLLKGTIFQGYKCGKCQKNVHKGCLNATDHCVVHPVIAKSETICLCKEYPWIADRMTRVEAESHLVLSPEGTFLLRWSERHRKHILSLKALGEVKHMRVLTQEDTGFCYLSEARFFKNVVDLINYYHQSPLSESFTGLECCLRRPLYDTAIVKFPYESPDSRHLQLIQGQHLTILSRDGEARGWWKGRVGGKVGYFPKDFVTVEPDYFNGPW